jgi:hypothetical protein
MRHPHGLRAAAGVDTGLAIGEAYEGGFFAGYISHTADSVATHALIVAPAATGASGTGYTITTNLQWKTTNTTTAGTASSFDGAANSANMNNASHPAAQFCEGLSIGGYTDWYLPARYELEIAYENLKPPQVATTLLWGINAYSVPERTVNRTAGTPAQTTVAAFKLVILKRLLLASTGRPRRTLPLPRGIRASPMAASSPSTRTAPFAFALSAN